LRLTLPLSVDVIAWVLKLINVANKY